MERIFMTKTEKGILETKMVGVHISKKDANRLALLSLTKGVPRTSILKEIINTYLLDELSLPTLIELAVKMSWKGFLKSKTRSNQKFKLYCDQTKIDLKSHRMENDIIELIIKGLKIKYAS